MVIADLKNAANIAAERIVKQLKTRSMLMRSVSPELFAAIENDVYQTYVQYAAPKEGK